MRTSLGGYEHCVWPLKANEVDELSTLYFHLEHRWLDML